MHVSNLGKIERGQANPNLATLTRIATALDTTLADLVRAVRPEHVPERDRRITARDLLHALNNQRPTPGLAEQLLSQDPPRPWDHPFEPGPR